MRPPSARLLARVFAPVLSSALVVLGVSTSSTAADSAGATLAMGQCTTSANAVVAVDFAHWGGPIVRACGSTPTSGFDLVNEGGFHTVGTQHDGPGFICRISSSSFGGTAYPRASEPGEACVVTPPTSGYWSYWHADAGQNSWSYSQTGALEYSPPPGSVDLWVFGATSTGGGSGSGVPSFSPNTVRARNADPTGTVPTTGGTVPTTGGTVPTTGGPSARPGSTGSKTSTATPTALTPGAETRTAVTGGTTRAPTGTSSPSASDPRTTTSARASVGGDPTSVGTARTPPSASPSPGGTPAVVDATSVASPRGSSGSAWPVIVAILVAAVLAGGAGMTVLRRRRSS